MTTAKDLSEPEIVTDIIRCREVVTNLLKQPAIAVDAEGVQLGKDGPMTLLQVGTEEGKVYLFDVQENKKLFTDGRLADVLQSNDVTKDIHSCSNDSAALYFQFKIRLRNVFDTQIAHLVIEEGRGRRLVRLLKLEAICQTYSHTSAVAENKEELVDLWTKEVGDFWAKRPLTKDMIKYAAGDVTALIPEVYETQKSYIQDIGLWDEFNGRVEEEILYGIDDSMRKQRLERVQNRVKQIVDEMSSKYDGRTTFADISDEEEEMALKRIDFRGVERLSPLISRLKTESLKAELKELEEQIDKEGDGLRLNWRPDRFLFTLLKHPDKDIQRDAKRIRDRYNKIIMADISRKYNPHTSLNMVSQGDKEVLRNMYPKGTRDPSYNATQLSLYWSLMAEDLDCHIERFRTEGRNFTLSEGYYRRLKFYYSADVPMSLKSKAKSFLQSLNQMFGRDRVPKPTY